MIPQYAKSTDPEVVAATEHNLSCRQQAVERIINWAAERGNDRACVVKSGAAIRVAGLHRMPEGFGRWTSERPHRPFKGTPEAKLMAALTYEPIPIPGAVFMVLGDLRIGSSHPFVRDGVAYLGWSFIPNDPQETLGPQWTEILGSEYLAAREACTEGGES